MSEVRIKLDDMHRRAKQRPDVNLEEVFSKGRIEGNFFVIDTTAYQELRRNYLRDGKTKVLPKNPGSPSIIQQGKNALQAGKRILEAVKKGEPILVSQEKKMARQAICEDCDLYTGFKCTACGCIGTWKQWLQTETGQCPKGLW